MSGTAVRRVVLLLVAAVVVGVAATVALDLLDRDPSPPRVVLVAVLVGAVVAAVLQTSGEPAAWENRYQRASIPPGQDARTSLFVRMLDGNRTAATPDPVLRDRLRRLTDQTLQVRHGLTRDDPRGAARVGPRLRSVLDGAPRRLSAGEVDACLSEIEAL